MVITYKKMCEMRFEKEEKINELREKEEVFLENLDEYISDYVDILVKNYDAYFFNDRKNLKKFSFDFFMFVEKITEDPTCEGYFLHESVPFQKSFEKIKTQLIEKLSEKINDEKKVFKINLLISELVETHLVKIKYMVFETCGVLFEFQDYKYYIDERDVIDQCDVVLKDFYGHLQSVLDDEWEKYSEANMSKKDSQLTSKTLAKIYLEK